MAGNSVVDVPRCDTSWYELYVAFETTAIEERAGFVFLKARATGMAVEIGWQRKLVTGAPGGKKLTTLLAVNEDLGVPTDSQRPSTSRDRRYKYEHCRE